MLQNEPNLKHQVDGVAGPLAYQSIHGRTPLICIHGFGGSGLDFEALSVQMNPRFQTIGINVPGHGGLDVCSNPLNQLANTVEQFNQEPIVLLGYSMGGRIALSIALTGRLNIAHLVLIGTTPGIPTPDLRHARIQFERDISKRLKGGSPTNFESWWRSLEPIASQSNMPEPYKSQMRQRRALNNLGHLDQMLAILGTGSMSSMWSDLERINVPTDLIVGEHDQKYSKIAGQMQTLIPQAHCTTVKGCGHAPHLEAPAATATSLNARLENLVD
jgi:2-succinyl-6-hydroxy-2,4-cyclohexadiene-1-carboxylate synthase